MNRTITGRRAASGQTSHSHPVFKNSRCVWCHPAVWLPPPTPLAQCTRSVVCGDRKVNKNPSGRADCLGFTILLYGEIPADTREWAREDVSRSPALNPNDHQKNIVRDLLSFARRRPVQREKLVQSQQTCAPPRDHQTSELTIFGPVTGVRGSSEDSNRKIRRAGPSANPFCAGNCSRSLLEYFLK